MKKIFVPEILGKRGSEMDFLDIFSETLLTILFVFTEKEDILVLR